jgi:hypothetical protein
MTCGNICAVASLLHRKPCGHFTAPAGQTTIAVCRPRTVGRGWQHDTASVILATTVGYIAAEFFVDIGCRFHSPLACHGYTVNLVYICKQRLGKSGDSDFSQLAQLGRFGASPDQK